MNIINRVLDERIYKIVMIFLSLLFCVPYLMEIVDFLIDLCIIWGCLIILKVIAQGRLKIKKWDIVLFLFLITYGITIVVNGFNFEDIKVLIYLSICFIIFFHTASEQELIGGKQVLDVILKGTFLFCFIVSILSLGMLFTKALFIIYTELTTNVYFVGVHANHSLYGVIGNSNRLSWLAIISIGISLYYLYQSKSKKVNSILLWMNIIMQTIVIYFTNSRGGMIGLIVFAFFFVVLISKYKYRFNFLKSFLISLAVISIIILGDPAIKSFTKYTIGNLTPSVIYEQHLATKEQIFSAKIFANGFINKSVHLSEAGFEKDNDKNNNRSDAEMGRTTSARLDAYKAGFKLFFKYPLLGLGKENSAKFVKDVLPQDSQLRKYDMTTNLHSVYITALVASGVIGFLILLIFMLRIVYRLFIDRHEIKINHFALIAVLLSLMAINLFESEILYTRVFSALFFWYLLGIISNNYVSDKYINFLKIFKKDRI